MEPLVLGVDVGGTASRAAVTAMDGTVVGRGAAGGGNPVSVPLDQAAAAVGAAVREALAGIDPARVRSAVMGIAGTSDFGDSQTGRTFQKVWDDAGLACPVATVGDVVVAFAAGTDRERGTVLVAGTGAVAARIDGGRIARVSDGLGWLLGDLGSGFWIGRSAATATAVRLQEPLGHTALTRAVAEAVTGRTDLTDDDFAQAVYRRPVRELSRLAPLVDEAATGGDALAAAILDEAARHLGAAAAKVREPGDADPIVLAGSVLRECRSVRTGLTRLLSERWPLAEVRVAGPGELGAARLAAAGGPPGPGGA